MAIGTYAEPRRGATIVAPGFNPGLIKKTKSVLAGFLPEESKNRDKTQNIYYQPVSKL